MRNRLIKCFNEWVMKTQWYNDIVFKDCRKFWELKAKDIDVINLGSTSGVYDFDYSKVNVNGANWAIAPQTMCGDFAILQQYYNRLKPGAAVVYPFCPFTSISGAAEYIEDRCYSFLNYDLIPNAHYIRLTKIKMLKESPWLYYPLSRFKTDIFYSLFHRMPKVPVMNDVSMEIDALNFYNSWMKQFELDDLTIPFVGGNKQLYDQGVQLLRYISAFCKDHHLRLIIVIPPMYKSLANLFSYEARINLMDSFVYKGIDTSVQYYNMMDDERFSNDISLFRNSYYFNPTGAQLYTETLLKKIL